MTNHQIQISKGQWSFIADPNPVNFESGDSITFFSVPGTGSAVISFSWNADAVFSLGESQSITLEDGSSVTFTTKQAAGGAAVRIASAEGTPDDANISAGMLRIETPLHKPGPVDPFQH